MIGLLALATWSRIGGMDLGWFMLDQVRDALEARKIAQGLGFPLIGPVASGLWVLGPLYYYVIALPFAFCRDPAVAVAFLHVLNLASIYLTYRLGTEVFGPSTGLIAAGLYAIFPMAAISAMTLWNPGFIPAFSVLFMYSLYRFIVGQHPWWLTITIVSLSALLQIHLTGGIFAVLLIIALILFRPRVPTKALAWGVLLGLAMYAPYLFFEFQRGFQDVRQIFAFARENWSAAQAQSSAVVIWRALSAPFLLPEQFALALAHYDSPPLFSFLQRVELVLFGLGLLYLLLQLARQPNQPAFILLALWLVLPLGLLSRKKVGLLWYYFDVLYPVQFLLIGVFLSAPMIWEKVRNKEKIRTWMVRSTVLLAIAIVISQAWFLRHYQRAISRDGVFRFPTTISLGNPDPWGPFTKQDPTEVLETMPMRFKRALSERFEHLFPAGKSAVEQNIHGIPFLSLREDKGYFFALQSKPGEKESPNPEQHYVILRDDLHSTIAEWGKAVRVGPFRIVAYQPWIRYSSWRYNLSHAPGWYTEGFDDAGWGEVSIPARIVSNLSAYADVPFFIWGGAHVFLRGWIDAPAEVHHFQLVLCLRDDFAFPHRVNAIHINGQEVRARHSVTYKAVLAQHSEVTFDVAEHLRPGANLVAFHIMEADLGIGPRIDPSGQLLGPGVFDLDVYEFRRDDAPPKW